MAFINIENIENIKIGDFVLDPMTLGIAVLTMLIKTIGGDTFWTLIDKLKADEISLDVVESIIPNDEYSKRD
jgi:hypothetical protein